MKILKMVVTICLGLVQLACTGGQASPTVPEPEVEVLDTSAPQALGKLLSILKDVSGSQNDDQLKEVLPEINSGIKQFASSFDGIEVTFFANSGRPIWQENSKKFMWGAPPAFKQFDENQIFEKAPKSVKMFAPNKEQYLSRAREKYEMEKNRLLGEYNQRVERALKELSEYLLQKPTREPNCTKFSSLAARVEKDDLDYSLILTDGWPDCPDERSGSITPVNNIKGKLAILQLTRKADTQANDEEYLQREGFLHALFPTARIFPAYRSKEAVEALFK